MGSKDQFGQIGPSSSSNDTNSHDFLVRQHVNRVRTMMPVKVINVADDGNSVDVQPLVKQVDGAGNSVSHGVVYSIPVHHMQGGSGMFKVTPTNGDIGMIHAADRDISGVVAAKGEATPGSNRTHDFADSVYSGGFGNVNGTPANYMTWGPGGLTIQVGGATYVFSSTGFAASEQVTSTKGITAGLGGSDSVTLQNHLHAGGPKPDAGT